MGVFCFSSFLQVCLLLAKVALTSNNFRLSCHNAKQLTANVNSKIADKLRYLSVISEQTHLFLDIFESCYNHRQMSVKMKIKSHIQQKTEKILSVLKKFVKTTKNVL